MKLYSLDNKLLGEDSIIGEIETYISIPDNFTGITEDYDGTRCWYVNGQLHRIDGPALVFGCTKFWYQNNKYHRLDGPAIERTNGVHNWFLHGVELSPNEIAIQQRYRIQSVTIALSTLNLHPYIIFWILEWSECAYIFDLNPRSVIKMIEGIRNSREKIKR